MRTLHEFELTVAVSRWQPVLMRLLANPPLIACGLLHRDPWANPARLVSAQLQLQQNPRGQDFPAMADWLVMAAPGGEPPTNPDVWLERLQPQFAQLLVILLVGYGPNRDVWRGWCVERGQVQPLHGFRVIGPGMVHVGRVNTMSDTTSEDRWSRVRGAVGESTFSKIRGSRVAVVGCSRSGTLMACELAALGVGQLVLFDGDAVELHNLDGMILAQETDIGENKAIVLGRRLIDYRPDLMVKAIAKPWTNADVSRALSGVDLLITCVDNNTARLRAALWCRDHLVPHLDIGTGVTQTGIGERQLAGDVRLLLPGNGCVCCCGGFTDLEGAEYELHAPPGALPRRKPEAWNARARLGSLITLNALAVSMAVQSWLDLLDGSLRGSIWHRLEWHAGSGLQTNSALVDAAERCTICNKGAAQVS